jgi:hypothetical protein
MKLKQINFTKKPTPLQIEKLKEIIPYTKIHSNGKILVKKLNKHFDNYDEILKYKQLIQKETGIKVANMKLTVGHIEEYHM